jgi:NADPH:quinone reductase-like Zn-dependent oxidoreductase
MKAITCRSYGPPEVLKLEELPIPRPGKHELLIQVRASAVNSADWRIRKPDPAAARLFFGLLRPRRPVPGGVLAGIVHEIGPGVTRFKPGDRVFGSTGLRFGAYAEYVCLPESASLAAMPANTSFREAAAIPFGALTALHFLRKADIKPGQSVLIYGLPAPWDPRQCSLQSITEQL